MNQKVRLIGGYSLVGCLLLALPSCASLSRRYVSLDSARETLQAQFPELLQSFDLHQGVFSVTQATWDTLAPGQRLVFLDECSKTRSNVIGRSAISVRSDGDMLATFDGTTTVLYGGPSVAFAGVDAILEIVDDGSSPGASGPAPALLSLPRPVYPVEALKRKVEGTVIVEALIGADGRVQEIDLVDGGIAMLNPAALEAVRNARFQPFLDAGIASVRVRVPMRFSIEGTRTIPQDRPQWNFGRAVDVADDHGRSPARRTEK